MISFDHSWLRNPFALKEMLDLGKKLFGSFREASAADKSNPTDKVSASAFTKEDEAEFELLMRALKQLEDSGHYDLRLLKPHTRVNELIKILKDHQSDDLRYTIVKMSLRKYFEKRLRISTKASAKVPAKEEFSWEESDKRYSIKDTRVSYLIYLAELVQDTSPNDVMELLKKRRVIKDKSALEEAKELAEKARSYLEERWQDIDSAAAESLLGGINFQGIVSAGKTRGDSDEEIWKNVESAARRAGETKIQTLKTTRRGNLRASDWIGIGILGVVVLLCVVAIVIKS